MSALVRLLGVYAPGHALDHAGRSFTFGRIDNATKAALTVSYFKRAREAVYAMRDETPEDEYDRQLKSVLDSYRRGEFSFAAGSESFRYFGGHGLPDLVAVLTGCKPDEARSLVEARAVEVLHLCLCVVYESLGEEDKKKILATEQTTEGQLLVRLLSATPGSNGSNSPKPTARPNSSAPASVCETSPA